MPCQRYPSRLRAAPGGIGAVYMEVMGNSSTKLPLPFAMVWQLDSGLKSQGCTADSLNQIESGNGSRCSTALRLLRDCVGGGKLRCAHAVAHGLCDLWRDCVGAGKLEDSLRPHSGGEGLCDLPHSACGISCAASCEAIYRPLPLLVRSRSGRVRPSGCHPAAKSSCRRVGRTGVSLWCGTWSG
jgi:hypothetical protein